MGTIRQRAFDWQAHNDLLGKDNYPQVQGQPTVNVSTIYNPFLSISGYDGPVNLFQTNYMPEDKSFTLDREPTLSISADLEHQFAYQSQEINKCDVAGGHAMSSEEAQAPLFPASCNRTQAVPSSTVGHPTDATVPHGDASRKPLAPAISMRPPPSQVSTDRSSGHSANAASDRSKHNKVERRYRANLNTKFLALGAALEQSHSQSISPEPGEESNYRRRKRFPRKASILEDALLYIRRLQKEKVSLEQRLHVLQGYLLN